MDYALIISINILLFAVESLVVLAAIRRMNRKYSEFFSLNATALTKLTINYLELAHKAGLDVDLNRVKKLRANLVKNQTKKNAKQRPIPRESE